MQCFHDYRFCPKISEEWAIDLNLSAPPPPHENLAPPPMYISFSTLLSFDKRTCIGLA